MVPSLINGQRSMIGNELNKASVGETPPFSLPGLSYHIISYHIISYHIISYHIISYHIISYHIISYHIIPSYHVILARVAQYLTDKNALRDCFGAAFEEDNHSIAD